MQPSASPTRRRPYLRPSKSRASLIAESSPINRRKLALAVNQLSLLTFTNCDPSNGVFRDPAFGENKSLPVHRWVPWIAGFSATFVDGVCHQFLQQQKRSQSPLVLDPFAGVGTTLLQATHLGYNAIGFEINPYPALAASTKLRASNINLQKLDDVVHEAQKISRSWCINPPPKDVAKPDLRTRIPFFSPRVERQVLHALAFISKVDDKDIADLFRIAFGSVIVGMSNYSYEPSLGTRPSAGKSLIEDADVGAILLKKLQHMRADIAWLNEEARESTGIGRGKVINANFLTRNDLLESKSVDLMITSPPYMNNYHYVRNTRPQLYWLSFISSPEEQRHLETGNFGKYWQTVRDSVDIHLGFEDKALDGLLNELRGIRKIQGAYGGLGWANYVASYFNDCYEFLGILKRVLKRKGVGVVVIGNSIIQGVEIKVEQILARVALLQGFTVEGIPRIRDKRVGASITQSSVRRGDRSSATLYESAVIVRKP